MIKGYKRAILANISLNVFIKGINYLFAFLTVLFAARILQPGAYGKANFVSSVTSYFVMLANLGMPTYAIRLCAENRSNREKLSNTVSELWSVCVILSTISFVLFLLFVQIIPRLREERFLFLIYSSEIIIQAMGFDWLYRGIERLKFLALSQTICKVVSFFCLVLLVHSEEQLPLYAIISVIMSYGSSIVCFFHARKYVDISFKINISHFKPLFIFFMMTFAVEIYNSLDLSMLGFMKTDVETGIYSLAAKGKSVLTLFGGVVWISILPQATRLWKEEKKTQFESLAGKTIVIVTVVQLVISFVCFVFAKEIVTIIGGSAYVGAESAFRILILSVVPIGISNILGGQVLIPSGKEIYLLKAETIGAIVNFVSNMFIIPIYSIEGAATTTVLSEVIVVVLCIYFAKKQLQMDFCKGLIRKVARKIVRKINQKNPQIT